MSPPEDKSKITITHHYEDETQAIEIDWAGEGPPPDESNSFLTCNLMVAIYKTMLLTHGIDKVIEYVEANKHIWAQGMEGMEEIAGEPIPGFEAPETVKLSKK